MDSKTIDRRLDRWSKPLLIIVMLTAFALRVYHLGAQPLSWDEGWSIGLSTLRWEEINRVTALDVHPPLFYYLFGVWLGLGRHELLMRLLPAILGLLAVPLTYATARAWLRPGTGEGHLVGVLGAILTACSPFLIYYSQVARMFSLCVALTLLATYCLLRALDTGALRFYAGFVLSAVAALYSFYYSAFVIAAVLLYALLYRPRRWRSVSVAAVAIALLYVPWLMQAVPPMLNRVGSRTGLGTGSLEPLRLLVDGVFGLVFAYEAGWPAVYVLLLLLAAAVLFARRRWEVLRPLTLPFLAVVLTLAAVSIGARAHMFAARYLITASPFLALAIAWAIGQLWRRAGWLGALGLLIALGASGPTLASYVYRKPYEISGAFDPGDDYRFLQGKTSGEDVVFYNVLSLAGHYERFRTENDPPWSYVLRWDPVVEPLVPALSQRVLPASSRHRRLWFVLYKGTVGANLELKQWLDEHLFPASGQWREDTLYLEYLAATLPVKTVEPAAVLNKRIRLRSAEFTARTESDGPVTVQIHWDSTEPIEQNYKVFVHLYAEDGRLLAQHDSVPMNELRPTWSWQPGELVVDRHGLWVPAGAEGSLRLVVGLYDPDGNSRLVLASGEDHVEIGIVEVVAKGVSG